jgi:bifunctional non-homologous end joining protein LigD/DNA ligase-1
MDIFDEKTISPMLIAENQPPFDSEEYVYELKLDGIRCLAYLDETGYELRNKRNKRLNATFPELAGIHEQVKTRCILDGELVVLNNGKPDFYELQRRSFMTNPVKIEMTVKKQPVIFTAFDIVYQGNVQITDLPLTERKKRLYDTVSETPKLALSRHIETKGVAFFELAKQQGLEGIVAKRKDSRYYFGKRTRDWIKMKALLDDDFVVCGYFDKEIGVTSVILGCYQGDRLVYQSHVAMGVSRSDYKIISSAKRLDKSCYADFPDFDGAVWIEPELVCTVQYMERTPQGGLRQPVFKGLRDDKLPEECTTT